MAYCCVFIIRALDDGIDRASLLAVSTVNAFGHVDIISSRPSRAIRTGFALDCYSSSWACSSTQFACNTSFFTCCISSECVFSSKFWRKWAFFIGVVDGPFRLENIQYSTEEEGIEIFRHDNLIYVQFTL